MSPFGFLPLHRRCPLLLESRINVIRSTAFGDITGNILEPVLIPAFRAGIRWYGRRDQVPAFLTLPKGQTTTGTDVPGKSAGSFITAMSARPFVRFGLHFLYLHIPIGILLGLGLRIPFLKSQL